MVANSSFPLTSALVAYFLFALVLVIAGTYGRYEVKRRWCTSDHVVEKLKYDCADDLLSCTNSLCSDRIFQEEHNGSSGSHSIHGSFIFQWGIAIWIANLVCLVSRACRTDDSDDFDRVPPYWMKNVAMALLFSVVAEWIGILYSFYWIHSSQDESGANGFGSHATVSHDDLMNVEFVWMCINVAKLVCISAAIWIYPMIVPLLHVVRMFRWISTPEDSGNERHKPMITIEEKPMEEKPIGGENQWTRRYRWLLE